VERLLHFIHEREAIRVRKERGDPPPWTDDPILREWSFCNVHRENDRVTRWIADHWRTPHADDPDLWFAMVVARHLNWPPALVQIGYPVPWRPVMFLEAMLAREAAGQKCFNDAYMINQTVPGGAGMRKSAYLADLIFRPVWEYRAHLRPFVGDTLRDFYNRLSAFNGFGSFMTGQVIADMKYVSPLREATDWWTFAASGPGSRRGLNRLLNRPINAPWREQDWYAELLEVRDRLSEHIILHAQDMQNCFCEFDKMERVRLGEGTPKRRYRYADSHTVESPRT
jgi:hypothetical protein